jgi:asparagine N-glycosylation enzyme membrane subunit Stt3
MDPFHKLAGSAAALYGGLQFLIISSWSAIAAIFHTENQRPLAFLLLIISVAIVVFIYLGKKNKISDED